MPALSLYDARYFCPSPVLNGVETSRLRLRPSPYLLLPPFSSPSLTSCKPISLSIANCFERGRSISGSRSEGGCADAENGVEAKGWIHFVGVGGCGLSALAMLALLQGFEVSGSDITWSSFMDRLQKAGARLFVGHSSSNIQRDHRGAFPSAVVYSSAVPLYNEEVLRARSAGIPTFIEADPNIRMRCLVEVGEGSALTAFFRLLQDELVCVKISNNILIVLKSS
ncbi:hypothetical protein ACLOJK_032219 [Asimina triloba]